MKTSAPYDLHFNAFRYVAGEMNPAECEVFELLLAEDQSARDAVVQAVELTQGIRVAESLVLESSTTAAVAAVHTSKSNWSKSIAWFSVGAAACLGLIWSLNLQAVHRVPVSAALAEAWSTQLERLSESDPASTEMLDEFTEQDSLDSEMAFMGEPAPAWMLEAVLGSEAAEDNEDTSAAVLES